MSSDLYHVRVESVAGDRLTCRVTAYDPRDDQDPPPSRTLALQFLWETWEWFRLGLSYHVQGGGMSPERAEELGRVAPIGPELGGQDICDGDWIRANVGRFIRRVQARDRDIGAWRDEQGEVREGVPQATLIITATDPRWLEHLRPGMEWETTSYDRDEKD
jgi:hypothetical protein